MLLAPGALLAQSAPTSTDDQTVENAYITEQLPVGDGRIIGDFVVGPGKVEFELEPGETKQVELTVSNRMGETKRFQLGIEDAAGSNDPAQNVVLLGDDRGPYTLKDYISMPEMEFELDHNMRARIPVTVSLPADAEPGGRYGSVVVSTVTRPASSGSDTGARPSSPIISRIGTLFFISTPGTTDIAGALQSFQTVDNKSIYYNGPIDFALLYQNTGSVHLNPYGEISISNMLGEEVGFIQIEPWFTLPQSFRTREVSWQREFLVGKYTATARINRGYDDVIDEQTLTFWVIPYKHIAGVFIGLFVLFLVLRFFTSRFELQRKVS